MDMHVRDMTETTAGIRPPRYRERLKIWLIQTMKTKNWSPYRWAKEADIAGTTITRFLNSEDPHRTPSARTVEKLARAAGVPAMHEPQQVFIGLIRRNQLLEEARKLSPLPVDLFKMVALDHLPAPIQYANCQAAEMDNGRVAICCPVEMADMAPGKRVLVMRNLSSVSEYWYDPPRLVPVETSDHFAGTLPVEGGEHQILGRMRGVFVPYD